MIEQPRNPITSDTPASKIITEPFKTEINVTKDTLIEDYPEGYAEEMRQLKQIHSTIQAYFRRKQQ